MDSCGRCSLVCNLGVRTLNFGGGLVPQSTEMNCRCIKFNLLVLGVGGLTERKDSRVLRHGPAQTSRRGECKYITLSSEYRQLLDLHNIGVFFHTKGFL